MNLRHINVPQMSQICNMTQIMEHHSSITGITSGMARQHAVEGALRCLLHFLALMVQKCLFTGTKVLITLETGVCRTGDENVQDGPKTAKYSND